MARAERARRRAPCRGCDVVCGDSGAIGLWSQFTESAYQASVRNTFKIDDLAVGRRATPTALTGSS